MGGDGVSESGWHISRGGKTYGALSDKEFRLLIEKGGVKTDDLIWRPGFEGWREAETVLSLSNPPPIPTKAAIPPARRRRVWKWGQVASIATAVVAALYVASPYYTLWRLKHAIENKDGLALESLVNWPRIRQQTKSEILAASYTSTLTDRDGFAALGTALGAAMVGPIIDSFVQPAWIIRGDNNPNFAEKIESLDVRSGYFVGPRAFRLDIEGPPAKFGEDPTKLGLILEFQGPGWRVTHVDLPWEQFAAKMKER